MLQFQQMKQKQYERYNKSRHEEFYLIGYQIDDDILTISVTGSTKNVYTMTMKGDDLTCDCPDGHVHGKKYKVKCKHICFLLFKVTKIFKLEGQQTTLLQQTQKPSQFFDTLRLTEQEKSLIHTYFINCPKGLINTQLQEQYQKIIRQTPSQFDHRTKPFDEKDTCPICCDLYGSIDSVKSCPVCQNYVHLACIKQWLVHNVTCVFCRSDCWSSFQDQQSSEDYINLEKLSLH